MCGIFALFNCKSHDQKFINENFMKGQKRGPETSVLKFNNNGRDALGFHRLAINGFNLESSEQPLELENCLLLCNGEVYNFKQLHEKIGVANETGSDCEVIIRLYKRFGIQYTLNLLDGVYAFVLFDIELGKYFVARDTYGVRPLFISGEAWDGVLPLKTSTCTPLPLFGLASEMKQLVGFYNGSKSSSIALDTASIGSSGVSDESSESSDADVEVVQEGDSFKIRQFRPGHYLEIETSDSELKISDFIHYSTPNTFINQNLTKDQCLGLIKSTLMEAVEKRVDNTDREIGCLLSGGLDSSLITSLVVNLSVNKFGRSAKNIHTWSIGMKGSEDLKYAQMVADHLGTSHHSIELHEQEFLDAIETVIYTIESYDTTSVRASVGNWLVCKYIRANSDAKVIFNGDGSDEVTGGYIYFNSAPNDLEFDKECRRLLENIYYFDVLRSDRSIASHGLEARTPFLDRGFVQTYLSLPSDIRCQTSAPGRCEKYLLREAFDGMDLLPKEVLWRTKEAFSDGVSKSTKSWFEMIQDFASENLKISDKKLAENVFYKSIYSKYFGKVEAVPFKWMPKFVEADDPSARTLATYKKSQISEK